MTTTTREQIEAARALVSRLDAEASHLPDSMRDALRTLLAATAQPTDEELAGEALTLAVQRKNESPTRIAQFIPAYIAGARREGRK